MWKNQQEKSVENIWKKCFKKFVEKMRKQSVRKM